MCYKRNKLTVTFKKQWILYIEAKWRVEKSTRSSSFIIIYKKITGEKNGEGEKDSQRKKSIAMQ